MCITSEVEANDSIDLISKDENNILLISINSRNIADDIHIYRQILRLDDIKKTNTKNEHVVVRLVLLDWFTLS